MAVSEKNMLLTGKDSAGNNVLLYPVTKLECVDGADELLSFTERQELTDEQKQIALQNLGITGGVTGGGDNSGNGGESCGSSCNCPTGTVNTPHTITWNTSVAPTVTFDIADAGYTFYKVSDAVPTKEQMFDANWKLSNSDGSTIYDTTLIDSDVMAENDNMIFLIIRSADNTGLAVVSTAGETTINYTGEDITCSPPETGIYYIWDSSSTLPTTITGSMTYTVEEEVNFVQADWNQNDSTKPDFIKNKPDSIGSGVGSGSSLPDVSDSDNGKIMTVVDGVWTAQTLTISHPIELPTVSTSDAGKFLRVSADGLWVAETIPNAEEASF